MLSRDRLGCKHRTLPMGSLMHGYRPLLCSSFPGKENFGFLLLSTFSQFNIDAGTSVLKDPHSPFCNET